MIIEQRAYARAGLLGNPSDGYYGKTISITVKNFGAHITLYESPELTSPCPGNTVKITMNAGSRKINKINGKLNYYQLL